MLTISNPKTLSELEDLYEELLLLLSDIESIGIEWALRATNVSDKDLKHIALTKEFKGINIK